MGTRLTDEERKSAKGFVGQAYRALLDPSDNVTLDRETANFLLTVLCNMHHLECYSEGYAKAVARATMESGRRKKDLDLFRLMEEDEVYSVSEESKQEHK